MIYLITALPCEAKPLIDAYRLKHQVALTAFPCYLGEGKCLVVSGLGRIAMAAATAYIGAAFPTTARSIWLNIGIVGHVDLPQGSGVMVHKVVEHASSKSWYPILTSYATEKTAALLTVDKVLDEYQNDFLHDMEGSAFMETASRFTIFEFIHLYKIVSDNKLSGIAHINKEYVTQLVTDKLGDIDMLIQQLEALRASVSDTPREALAYTELMRSVSFSVTQQNQLLRLLQRLYSLAPAYTLDTVMLGGKKSSKQVLLMLENIIANLALPERIL